MNIFFRTDASLKIATGHVMRCLSLANALKEQGANCRFICREHPGNLLKFIEQKSFEVIKLPIETKNDLIANSPPPSELDWLVDAEQTQAAIENYKVSWLIVDHYELDIRWEKRLQAYTQQLMVIDDLANRAHACNLLLDQNLGRKAQDYASSLPSDCKLLIGPEYALLRPEFSALREYSLKRRQNSTLKHLLISMGGVDQDNATAEVLQALKISPLAADCQITVVMGLHAPHLKQIRELAEQMPWPTEVVVNIIDMAQRMADSDLAIGAAGITAWERCCLGLPSLLIIMAENQRSGAHALDEVHASYLIGTIADISTQLPKAIEDLIKDQMLTTLSLRASEITDGLGITRTLQYLENSND